MAEEPLDDETIFNTAIMMGPDARDAYLVESCGDDEALLNRLRRMLDALDKAPKFLESPPPEISLIAEAAQEPSSIRVAGYELDEQIGKGAFGVVYRAQQVAPLQREVALKIIKAGTGAGALVARFETERQTLAMMEHPNIAKVFDVGTTEDGRLFLAMELIRGHVLTEFANEEGLNLKGRLELFVQVCRAIEHAHQKSVIHRDLKPSNIMVTIQDGQAIPKVIDFGIAKVLTPWPQNNKQLTVGIQVLGTPLYMSPEQAAGESVDTRSDVYSLGVILYELLTGQTPIDPEAMENASLATLQELIRKNEPRRPSDCIQFQSPSSTPAALQREGSSVIRAMSGELDWIVLRTLEKEPRQRYGTASALADDIERFLKDEPIEARPPSTWYQLRKFARRNRSFTTVAGAVLTTLVLTVVVSLVASFSIDRARREVVAQEQAAKLQRDAALRSIKRLLTEADQTLKELPGLNVKRERILQGVLSELHKIRSIGGDCEELHMQIADTCERLGILHRNNGQLDRAEEDFATNLRHVTWLAENEYPNKSVSTANLAVAIEHQGDLAKLRGQLDKAIGLYRRSLAISEAADDNKLRQPIFLRFKIGDAYSRQGEFRTASAWVAEAGRLAIRRAETCDDFVSHMDLSNYFERAAKIEVKIGSQLEAREYFTRALRETEHALKIAPHRADVQENLIGSLDQVASINLKLGDLTQASDYAKRSVERAKEFFEVDRGSYRATFRLGVAYALLGKVLTESDIEAALPLFQQGRELLESSNDHIDKHPDHDHRLATAVKLEEMALKLSKVLAEPRYALTLGEQAAGSLDVRAKYFAKRGNFDEAIRTAELNLELSTHDLKTRHLLAAHCFWTCLETVRGNDVKGAADVDESQDRKLMDHILQQLNLAIKAGAGVDLILNYFGEADITRSPEFQAQLNELINSQD